MGRFSGKVALVTGAGSTIGMGFAVARRLAREGASVMVTDLDETAVRSAAREIGEVEGVVLARGHDVTSEADWADVVADVSRNLGGLNILVNNAGIALTKAVEETSIDDFERVSAVNLRSVFLGCRHALPEMRKLNGGTIINMSSVAGLGGVAFNSVYSATKAGVRLLSKSIAVEVAKDNIRCNSVHPGVIDTAMVRSVIGIKPENSTIIIGSIPMGRLGTAEEVAACVLFLASDEATYVTGADFVVDGGLTA